MRTANLDQVIHSCDALRIMIADLLKNNTPKTVDAVTLKRLCLRFDTLNPELAESFYKRILNGRDARSKHPFEKCLMASWRCLAIKRCRKRGKCVRYFLGEFAQARSGSRLERLALRQALHFARRIKDPASRYIHLAYVREAKQNCSL